MSKIYQVKISLKHENPKFKTQTICGVVVTSDQPKAVSIAMENTKKLIKEKELPFIPKLVSASSLPNDFVYSEPEPEVKPTEAPTTEAAIESEDHA